jgi:glycosyltransferase involved in cell wall biosynthesis/peptidoglycan/xylan/chitin deacetylase (PgdA/CDA1 family)
MHIVFIVENNSVPRDRRVWAEAQAAREFGHLVSIICPKDNVSDPAWDKAVSTGIHIYRHPRPLEGRGVFGLIFEYLWAFFLELLLCVRIYSKMPFQVIHAANPPDHTFLIALIFRPFGVKYIFDHHDLTPENYVAKFENKGFLHAVLMMMERLTFSVADVVISTNNSYRHIASTRGKKPADDIFVVRNGPQLENLPALAPNENLRAGFSYLVGYVGIIGKQEGIENLLEAIEYIVKIKKRTDIKFIIVGTGTHWRTLIRMAEQLGIGKYVWFTGYIPDNQLYEVLSTVDLCVNPEFRNEFTDKSTMIKIMEYMAFAKPIVQFYTAAGEESAGPSALYVRENSIAQFADAVIELLEDKEKRITMGQLGRERTEKVLCWERQKTVLREAYSRILSKERGLSPPLKLNLLAHYLLKPLIPRSLQLRIRRIRAARLEPKSSHSWPIGAQVMAPPKEWPGWPEGKRFAFVLTHDVDSSKGLPGVLKVMELEKALGLHSSFNFVLKDYDTPSAMRDCLTENGFEVGIHGVHHTPGLYLTKRLFRRHALLINEHLRSWKAAGFRSPAMYHNLEWLHELNIRYDTSTFDTDPFEPQPDGAGTIFPFLVSLNGSRKGYVELPYTLPQDFTLFVLLEQATNEIWKKKLDWIALHSGMALSLTHPDYISFGETPLGKEEYPVELYAEFLQYVCQKYKGQFWNPLPCEVAEYVRGIYGE